MRHSKATEIITSYEEYLYYEDVNKVTEQYNNQLNLLNETIEKFNKNKEENFENTETCIIFMKKVIPNVVNIHNEKLEKFKNTSSKFKKLIFKLMNNSINIEGKDKKLITSEEVIYITLQTILKYVGSFNNRNTITKQVINNIQTQQKNNILKYTHLHYYNAIQDNTTTDSVHMRKVHLSRAFERLNIDEINLINLNNEEKLKIGAFLVNHFLEMGIFNFEVHKKAKATTIRIKISEEYENILNEIDTLVDLNELKSLPMVIKPKPWVDTKNGGYLGNEYINSDTDFSPFNNYILNNEDLTSVKGLQDQDLDKVYNCLNTLQDVPFTVNDNLKGFINKLWNNNSVLGKLDFKKELRTLPKPIAREDYQGEQEFQVALKKYRDEVSEIHTENHKTSNKKIVFNMVLDLVNKFSKYDEFFIPKILDFRGRVYDNSAMLNNQLDDLTKSLIKFKNKKEIGKNGFKWMKINIANLFGNDKVSFKDRAKWTEDNTRLIELTVEYAESGEISPLLRDADKPYQFLAAIYEYVEAIKLNNPKKYKSQIECQLDGSCSGIQHYSGLLKDKDGGSYVNLLKNDVPSDIYGKVAYKMLDVLNDFDTLKSIHMSDTFNRNLLRSYATMWKDSEMINRKFCKKGVMTTPYSVKFFGLLEQIREFMKDYEKENIIDESLKSKESILFITKILEYSINNTLVGAYIGMNYIKDLVKTFYSDKVNEKVLLEFTNILGFKCTHKYNKFESVRISTFFGKLRIKPNVFKNLDNVDKNKNLSSIAPNYIHMQDSTHLMLSVNAAREAGIKDFKVIHDSFATHYADTEEFHHIIKQQFIELYKNDLLFKLKEEFKALSLSEEVKTKLDELEITYGTLDIEDIIHSDYIFS